MGARKAIRRMTALRMTHTTTAKRDVYHQGCLSTMRCGVQERWAMARSVVAGRCVNGYSRKDWVLALRCLPPPPLNGSKINKQNKNFFSISESTSQHGDARLTAWCRRASFSAQLIGSLVHRLSALISARVPLLALQHRRLYDFEFPNGIGCTKFLKCPPQCNSSFKVHFLRCIFVVSRAQSGSHSRQRLESKFSRS